MVIKFLDYPKVEASELGLPWFFKHVHTHTHTHTHAHPCTLTRTRAHTHTYTHTQSLAYPGTKCCSELLIIIPCFPTISVATKSSLMIFFFHFFQVLLAYS